jgi:hypothetical protein
MSLCRHHIDLQIPAHLAPQGPAPYKGARREFLLRWQTVLLAKYGLSLNLIWRVHPEAAK